LAVVQDVNVDQLLAPNSAVVCETARYMVPVNPEQAVEFNARVTALAEVRAVAALVVL
jgi:hypothetical protein